LNLLELPKEIREKMDDGKIALGYPVPLVKLKEYPPAQKQLAYEIQSGYGMNIQRTKDSKEARGWKKIRRS